MGGDSRGAGPVLCRKSPSPVRVRQRSPQASSSCLSTGDQRRAVFRRDVDDAKPARYWPGTLAGSLHCSCTPISKRRGTPPSTGSSNSELEQRVVRHFAVRDQQHAVDRKIADPGQPADRSAHRSLRFPVACACGASGGFLSRWSRQCGLQGYAVVQRSGMSAPCAAARSSGPIAAVSSVRRSNRVLPSRCADGRRRYRARPVECALVRVPPPLAGPAGGGRS